MEVKADSWTVSITQAEIEQLIREKTGQEFPECYFEDIRVENGVITIDVVAE